MCPLLKHITFFILFMGTFLGSYGQHCKIGDVVINRNDLSKGVVFWINPEKSGGWMVALKEISTPSLASIPYDLIEQIPTYHFLRDTAGYTNTVKLRSICEPGDYGIYQVDIEHGWYIPALGQALQLVTYSDMLNSIFARHGGDIMEVEVISSSPCVKNLRYYKWDFNFHIRSFLARGRSIIRPVRTFSMSDILIDTTLIYEWNTGATTSQTNDSPTATTTYTVKATTLEGCSTEASAQVFVSNTPQVEIYDTIRRGETYMKYGFHETEPNIYRRTMENDKGCTSEIVLHLHVLEPLPPTVFDATICEGQVYSRHNFTAWEAGTYTQSWTAVDGRDSTVILNLTVNPVDTLKIEASICPGKRYTANGFDETEAGRYIHTFTSRQGCDSVVTLQLNILPEYFFTEEKTICQGESYNFRGKTLSVAGVYHDSLKTVTGCDSIYKLILNITDKITNNIEASICPGERFTANGFDETEAGTYIHTFTSRQGCDSVVTLELDILPDYLFDDEQTIRQGESYRFRGQTLKNEGIYYDSLKTVAGCDSIYQLKLNVSAPAEENEDMVIPNTFSPNGDGINDVFMPGQRVKIVNRNGAVIFNGENGWDGSCKGGQASEGVYFYILYLKTEQYTKEITGYIHLTR